MICSIMKLLLQKEIYIFIIETMIKIYDIIIASFQAIPGQAEKGVTMNEDMPVFLSLKLRPGKSSLSSTFPCICYNKNL